MTVRELIVELQRHDLDQKVYVRGYEDGLCDVATVHQCLIKRDANPKEEHWLGPHKTAKDGEPGLFLEGHQP